MKFFLTLFVSFFTLCTMLHADHEPSKVDTMLVVDKPLSDDGAIRSSTQGVMIFLFDTNTAVQGATLVKMDDVYSAEKGYGFDSITEKCAQFSMKLPEGVYQIVVDCAAMQEDATVTIKSEQRRLMLENIVAKDCKNTPFTVHTRTARIDEHQQVSLKQREKDTEMTLWDERLTLEIFGTHSRLKSITVRKVQTPTIFIAGDSTVCDQAAEPWGSWGQMLPRFFSHEIVVANYAQSGESIKSSLSARRFEKIFKTMKQGDFLLIQFGHNDQKNQDSDALAVYKKSLESLVERTRALGATPILITSVERSSGVKVNTLAGYPDAVRSVASDKKCGLIDLQMMSQVLYQSLGSQLKLAFQDGTHHNNYGSYQLAKCVVEASIKNQLPIAKYIRQDVTRFDPAKPDDPTHFIMPASPTVSLQKPLGN